MKDVWHNHVFSTSKQVSIFHRTDLPLSAPNVHEPGHVLDWSIATANSGTSREEIRGIQAGESCTA